MKRGLYINDHSEKITGMAESENAVWPKLPDVEKPGRFGKPKHRV